MCLPSMLVMGRPTLGLLASMVTNQQPYLYKRVGDFRMAISRQVSAFVNIHHAAYKACMHTRETHIHNNTKRNNN